MSANAKVAIVSDSPTVTTGFGVTTDRIARALASDGHRVSCFGFKAFGETFNRADYPFRIWTIATGESGDWPSLLRRFVAHESPDVLLLNMDIFNLKEVLAQCQRAAFAGPIVSYLILDGVPAYEEYARSVGSMAEILVTTNAGARYVQSIGFGAARLAPPGVDRKIFAPLADRDLFRKRAGLCDVFLVGCFGRNTERKQQPRLLRALALLRDRGLDGNTYLYFHCDVRAYWKLDEIACELGVRDRVLFVPEDFDETQGRPFRASGLEGGVPENPEMPAEYGYVERLNCCDLIVNAAHCGDFENVLIEAQACGVPLAATDDSGIMAEAMGEGGILLRPADVGHGRCGQRISLVSPESIAEAIHSVRTVPGLGAELSAKGFQNSGRYPWTRLERAVGEAVTSAASNGNT